MIILLLLIFQLKLLLKGIANKSITKASLGAILVGFGSVCILHLEFAYTGVSTYGSDEQVYYNEIINAINSFDWLAYINDKFNTTYLLYGSLIINTSLTDSIILIRLCNVLLFVNSILFVYKIMTKYIDVNYNVSRFMVWFILFNGVVIWTAVRNLKDILFLYLLVIFIYILFKLLENIKINLWLIVPLTIIYYFIQDLRQWFIYLLLVLFASIIINSLLKRKKIFTLATLIVALSVIVVPFAQKGLNTFDLYTKTYSVTQQSLGGDSLTQMVNSSLLSLPMSMGRFILGPGPIRALFGSESFLFFTYTGNVLIFLGSLAWWLFLPLFLLSLISLRNIKKNYIIFLVMMFYWVVYSIAYAGSGDTRLRAVFYILAAMYTAPYLSKVRLTKNYNMIYYLILIAVIMIGLYFST
ncbi:hypothetical protein [Psychrobacillus sp. BM2]|uniref:hypothetical protein n=1 Tax=Psychrobacillus sp. BM2 TaxID=3400421 RepID=UPI003B02E26F